MSYARAPMPEPVPRRRRSLRSERNKMWRTAGPVFEVTVTRLAGLAKDDDDREEHEQASAQPATQTATRSHARPRHCITSTAPTHRHPPARPRHGSHLQASDLRRQGGRESLPPQQSLPRLRSRVFFCEQAASRDGW